MAKDNFFVLTYRILAYLAACFSAGEKPAPEMFSPGALGINNGYWVNTMKLLSDEGLISGVCVTGQTASTRGIRLFDTEITFKGMEYLQGNPMMAKAREALRTTAEVVPGI